MTWQSLLTAWDVVVVVLVVVVVVVLSCRGRGNRRGVVVSPLFALLASCCRHRPGLA